MLKLTALFAVVNIFLSVQKVDSRSLHSLNIQGILESLNNQLQLEQSTTQKKRYQLADDVFDQDYNAYVPQLNLESLVRSLNTKQQRQPDRDDSDDRDDDDDRRNDTPHILDRLDGLYGKKSRDLKRFKKPRSLNKLDDKDNRYNKPRSVKNLASLLGNRVYNRDDRHQKSRPVSALASLLDDTEDDRDDRLQGLSSYKSVYLVLDPEAVEKSHNKEKLGNLLSKLLNAFHQSNKPDGTDRRKQRHYQGYDDDSLRRRKGGGAGGSKERYVPDNSPERDYKPKRSRVERPSGGGSRTAIPYIGHRGDIYERDN